MKYNKDAFILYVPDVLDKLFFKTFVSKMLQTSICMKQDFGYYAEKAEFRGKIAASIYEVAMQRKYNFGLEMIKVDHYENCIRLSGTKKVRIEKEEGGIASGESLNGVIVDGWVSPPQLNFGSLGYTIEKTEIPEIKIQLVKLSI